MNGVRKAVQQLYLLEVGAATNARCLGHSKGKCHKVVKQVLERFIAICTNANQIVLTQEGKRRTPEPHYTWLAFKVAQKNSIEYVQKLDPASPNTPEEPFRLWNEKDGTPALLTKGFRDPITWGISLEELQARSFASSRKVSLEVAT